MAESLWKIPFGKEHRGKDVEDCPTDYLRWLSEQGWFEEKFPDGFRSVQIELEYRETWE